MRTGKIPIGEVEILLADKIIYLAVEFARLAEADFYVLTKVAELASDRWQPPRNKSKFAQNVRLGGRADK